VAQLAAYVLDRRWRAAAGLALVGLVPFGIFQLWLLNAFGSIGLGLGGAGASPLEVIPFNGIWRIAEHSVQLMWSLFIVYLFSLLIPALAASWTAVRHWLASKSDFTSIAVLANAAIYPFISFAVYREPIAVFRFASGLILAILLFLARHRHGRALNFAVLWIALSAILLAEF
jgi:hypothetical protein